VRWEEEKRSVVGREKKCTMGPGQVDDIWFFLVNEINSCCHGRLTHDIDEHCSV
jgi:hypothetical protein